MLCGNDIGLRINNVHTVCNVHKNISRQNAKSLQPNEHVYIFQVNVVLKVHNQYLKYIIETVSQILFNSGYKGIYRFV